MAHDRMGQCIGYLQADRSNSNKDKLFRIVPPTRRSKTHHTRPIIRNSSKKDKWSFALSRASQQPTASGGIAVYLLFIILSYRLFTY